MIKKLICFIWGHIFVAKAYTGNIQKVIGPLGNEHTISLYLWEAQKYCPRCGKPNPNYKNQ
jgi:hypothetical protein